MLNDDHDVADDARDDDDDDFRDDNAQLDICDDSWTIKMDNRFLQGVSFVNR